MNRKLNLGLSLATGLLGGLLSHYVALDAVHAQLQPAPPKEITAQSFVLTDSQGNPAGVFGFDKDGAATIKLFDKTGKVVWSAGGKANAKPLTINNAN